MKKRVFIIHGWGGSPENMWLSWLAQKLAQKGIQAVIPQMPNADEPMIKAWVQHLAKIIGITDADVYLVGHSIGCQTILRYLETLPNNVQVGGLICVAGFFHLPYLQTEDEKRIAKEWLESKIDFESVKSKVKHQIIAIFSDNDPDVPLSDNEEFKNKLGAQIIIEHQKGHFSDDAGIKELPVVLEELLKMSK